MITSNQFNELVIPISQLYEEFIQTIINDIARRLKNGSISSAAWQLQRISESGALYADAIRELSQLTGKSQRSLRELFERAGVTSMKFDDSIYKEAGLKPLPLNLSPQMLRVLYTGLQKTNGVLNNFNLSTANQARLSFLKYGDIAYLQVTSGTLSYDEAIRGAIKQAALDGLTTIDYASGHVDKLDVAMRRAVLTGVSQTTAQLQLARADEMGVDLVQTSAHIGARPTHQEWQGRIFSRSGLNTTYPDFKSSTGFGTGPGLCGWNCRHSFYPYYEGISERAYKKADVDKFNNKRINAFGKQMSAYEATQVQRSIERKIRDWKRQAEALQAASLSNTKESAKVRQWQARMREFIKMSGLDRQYPREQVYHD